MGWEVDEVVPVTCVTYETFGNYFYVAYIAMLCLQTWIGFECFHDRCEIVKLMVTYGGNFNTHLGGLRHLGNQVIACIFGNPGVPV